MPVKELKWGSLKYAVLSLGPIVVTSVKSILSLRTGRAASQLLPPVVLRTGGHHPSHKTWPYWTRTQLNIAAQKMYTWSICTSSARCGSTGIFLDYIQIATHKSSKHFVNHSHFLSVFIVFWKCLLQWTFSSSFTSHHLSASVRSKCRSKSHNGCHLSHADGLVRFEMLKRFVLPDHCFV